MFLEFNAPRETLVAIQRARNIADDEIEVRVAKVRTLNRAFLKHRDLFDAVIVNRFGEPTTRLIDQITSILTSE